MNGPILNMQLRETKREDGDKEQEKQGQPDRLEVARKNGRNGKGSTRWILRPECQCRHR